MFTNKKKWILVLALAIIVRIFAAFPAAVEKYYSNGIYPVMSRVLRVLFGWIPFSVGDLLYAAAGIFLLVRLVQGIRAVVKRQAGRDFWLYGLKSIVFWSLWIYVSFNLLWGLNYNRLGMAQQMQLTMKPYSTDELKMLVQVIIRRLDQTQAAAVRDRAYFNRHSLLFQEARQSYGPAADQYAFLGYNNGSIKPSIFSYMGDYLGFTGYYNPFTGEAQVNTTVPVFVQPFTTCHEMGHQLGYAKENEANFAGYLSAKSSHDSAFRYSVYFEMYAYAMRELYRRDSSSAKDFSKLVNPQVKKDFATLHAFNERYKNPLEPVITLLYGSYLRANQQPSGMQSYNEVTAFLVAYCKKYGEAAL
jgi:hypothetical protein